MTGQATVLTLGGQRESAGAILARAGATTRARSLYIHVPFCFHKCHYCDFYSFVDAQDRQEAFAEALCKELRMSARWAGALESVFVGGGTPTLLATGLWARLLDAMHEAYQFAPGAEFTVECNPETASTELMRELQAGGVNRISIGAQSFEPRHLNTLERWHEPKNVARAVELAREAGIARQSIDLIFGIPGQTLDDWQRDLDRALELRLEHLSCYALTYEPNTAMTKRLERGEIERIDEDLEAAMYEATVASLRAAGLERYEVSNFARIGGECRHNLAYWRQENWLAAGPSGSAHFAGWRWKNVPRLTDWMEGVNACGFAPAVDIEGPDARRALAEHLMTAVRLREGFDEQAIMERARALGVEGSLARALEKHIRQTRLGKQVGPLDNQRATIAPTDLGFLFADEVAADLIQATCGSER